MKKEDCIAVSVYAVRAFLTRLSISKMTDKIVKQFYGGIGILREKRMRIFEAATLIRSDCWLIIGAMRKMIKTEEKEPRKNVFYCRFTTTESEKTSPEDAKCET